MRHLLTASAMVLCAVLAGGAVAQTAAPKSVAKSAAKQPTHSTAHHPVAHTPAPAALTDEQLSIAQIVTTGRVACADGQSITITPDTQINGAFDLKFGGAKYDVVPVPTKSGAIRLEDRKTGIVFMQLANKSMLFNERAGKRLADDCINDGQRAVAEQMRAQPGNGVLDGLVVR